MHIEVRTCLHTYTHVQAHLNTHYNFKSPLLLLNLSCPQHSGVWSQHSCLDSEAYKLKIPFLRPWRLWLRITLPAGWYLDCCLLTVPPLWQKAEGFLWSFVSMSVPSIEASTTCSKVLPNTHLQILSLCRLGCRDTHLLQLFSLHTKVCQETNIPFTDSWFSTLWILHADSVPSMIRSPLDLPEHRSFAQRNCLWVMGRLQPPGGAGLSLSFFLLSLLFYFLALMTQATNSQFLISVFSRISRFIETGNWREKAVPDASGWGM